MRPKTDAPALGEDAFGVPGDHDLERADAILLQRVDAQMTQAYELGGPHLACRPGCTECCIGPFDINALEGWRLRRGVETLRRRDPQRAAALMQRAVEARERLRLGFPGDAHRGHLRADVAEIELETYFDGHADVPCPVLDPATGRCELYAHRPVTCRAYGPPVRLGEDTLDPCRLCFLSVPPESLEPYRVDLDPEGLEDTLLDALERGRGEAPRTLIAFALTDRMEAAANPDAEC